MTVYAIIHCDLSTSKSQLYLSFSYLSYGLQVDKSIHLKKRKSAQCNIFGNMSPKNVYIFLINLNKPSKSDEFYQETSIDLNLNDKEVDL